MKVALLGPPGPLQPWLREQGEEVVTTTARIDATWVQRHGIEFLVSFGYWPILRADVLDLLPGAAINLHISMLPWNRGSDPNLWSWLENTPKGVTIHHMDPGVDTGDIIVQREVALNPRGTFASTHSELQVAVAELFIEHWAAIRAGTAPRTPQPPGGTTHRRADSEPWLALLPAGYDTPVAALAGRALTTIPDRAR
jgi:methionyl-tRNA formyltransferase